jgi:mitogen-activated protein kinase 1/3
MGKGSGNTKRVRDSILKHKVKDDQMMNEISNKLLKDKDNIKLKKRSMSSHISSRWYRAPEVIILERQYDQAIDMWAIGCIIFELIRFCNKCEGLTDDYKPSALFPGMSCFPLSPKDGNKHVSASDDQMKEILAVIGPQTEQDLSFIHASPS